MTPCSCIGSQQNQEAKGWTREGGRNNDSLVLVAMEVGTINKAQVSIAHNQLDSSHSCELSSNLGECFSRWNHHHKGPVNILPVICFVMGFGHFAKWKTFWVEILGQKNFISSKKLVKKKENLFLKSPKKKSQFPSKIRKAA
jgi:hypothetical protein